MRRRGHTIAPLAPLAERLLAFLYPRRCPLCGALLGQDAVFAAVCPACAGEERRLLHTPPRLPATEHTLTGLDNAAGAYYYAGSVRHAILRCKQYGNPWYAQELADLMLMRVLGASQAKGPGQRPCYQNLTGLPLYDCIVPVPRRSAKGRDTSLPRLLARRLGTVLGIPVVEALRTARPLAPQKTLDRAGRLRNARGAYAPKPGLDLGGQRVLLVDDVITTGATISACALALQQAGAVEVSAICLAADEELPKEKQTPAQRGKPTKKETERP